MQASFKNLKLKNYGSDITNLYVMCATLTYWAIPEKKTKQSIGGPKRPKTKTPGNSISSTQFAFDWNSPFHLLKTEGVNQRTSEGTFKNPSNNARNLSKP